MAVWFDLYVESSITRGQVQADEEQDASVRVDHHPSELWGSLRSD